MMFKRFVLELCVEGGLMRVTIGHKKQRLDGRKMTWEYGPIVKAVRWWRAVDRCRAKWLRKAMVQSDYMPRLWALDPLDLTDDELWDLGPIPQRKGRALSRGLEKR